MRAVWALILLVGMLFLTGERTAEPVQARIVLSSADELRALSRRVAAGDTLFGCEVYLATDLENVGYFLPIGTAIHPFEGAFDGGGHVLSGVVVDGYLPCSGLFGCIGKAGSVRNLSLRDCLVSGRRYTGALVGLNAGVLKNCGVYRTRVRSLGSGEGAYAGALSGAVTGPIRVCEAAECTVEGAGELGGLVGKLYAGSVRVCRVGRLSRQPLATAE